MVDLPAQPASPVAISLAFQGLTSSLSLHQCCISADTFEVMAASSESTASGKMFPIQHTQASVDSSEAGASPSPIIFLGAPQCTFGSRIPPRSSPHCSSQGKGTPVRADPGTAQHPAVSQKSVDIQLPHVAVDLDLEVFVPLAMIIQEVRRQRSPASQSSGRASPELPSSPDGKSSHAAEVKSSKSLCSSTMMMSVTMLSLTGQLLHNSKVEHSAQMESSTCSATGLAFWANHLELNMQTSRLEVRITVSTDPARGNPHAIYQECLDYSQTTSF